MEADRIHLAQNHGITFQRLAVLDVSRRQIPSTTTEMCHKNSIAGDYIGGHCCDQMNRG